MYDINTLQINTAFPCLIVYLLDQSGSMYETFADGTSKAQKVADAINEVIFETGLKCYSSGGELKNRFELSVVGYGGSENTVEPAWQGALQDHWVVSISDVFTQPVGEQDGIPVWITPRIGSNTPMNRAFQNAYRICESWINWGNHRDCHPPIVINITDGEATDAGYVNKDLKRTVNDLKSLSTNYGAVNIFNIHISISGGDSQLFPASLRNSNSNSELLFELSTPLTNRMVEIAQDRGYDVVNGSKGYIYNGSAKNLIDFLNIGSNPI